MALSLVFADAPRRVYWEITRACDLACLHCRAEAAPCADPRELNTATGLRLLARLARANPRPHVIFTGGDPLKRKDLFQLIAAARELGMGVSVSPSGTPLLTEEAIDSLLVAGVEAISVSIDGSTPERHDAVRGVPGCLERSLVAARRAHQVGLPFQVNTLVSAETVDEMPAIEEVVRSVGASRWSLFFLVAVGRGTTLSPISPARSEELLVWLAGRAREPGLVVTTTEAPHFRRVMRQAPHEPGATRPAGHGAGIRDGNGVMFISHDGEVSPSGFMPLSAGNVKLEDPIAIYRDAPLFRALRDADGFSGRCGRCEFRMVCGGSRARAYVATGDPLAEDPLCTYQPRLARPSEPPSESVSP